MVGSEPVVDRGHLRGGGVAKLRKLVHLLGGAVGEALRVKRDLVRLDRWDHPGDDEANVRRYRHLTQHGPDAGRSHGRTARPA